MGRGNSLPMWCVGRQRERWKKKPRDFGGEHILMELIGYYLTDERLPEARVAEIGVAQGTLAKRAVGWWPHLGHYVCVDPWKPYPEWADRPLTADELSVAYWEGIYKQVVLWAADKKSVQIVRAPSVEAAKRFPDNFFDIVFIDSVHDWPNGINDIYAWLPKVKDDGILCGHDYVKRFEGMIRAVDTAFGDHFLLEDDTGGSWWVHLSAERKIIYETNVRKAVGIHHLDLLDNPPNLHGQEVLP